MSEKLELARLRLGDHRIAWMRDQVASWADDAAMHEAIGVLPRTLLHADMSGSNIIVNGEQRTLIDWGQAAVGPPFRDLLWSLEDVDGGRLDEHMVAYLEAWQREGGTPYEPELFEMSWWHAVAHARCTYGSYHVVVEDDVQTSYEAVREGNAALGALRRLLDIR